MDKDIAFTPKQVGQRIKERRNEINISMPELGRRVGVNQVHHPAIRDRRGRPQAHHDYQRTGGRASHHPEWLTGLSDEKEYNSKTLCQMDIEKHIAAYLDELTTTVQGEPHQQLLTTFLGQIVDLYSVFCVHFARAMAEADHIAEDEGLKKSLMRYAIESGAVIEKVYRREMETPVEDMKRFMDGLLHIYDEGRTKMKIGDLLDMSSEARERLNGQN